VVYIFIGNGSVNIDTFDSFHHSRERIDICWSVNAVSWAFTGRSYGRLDHGLRSLAAPRFLGLLGGGSALLPLASSSRHFFSRALLPVRDPRGRPERQAHAKKKNGAKRKRRENGCGSRPKGRTGGTGLAPSGGPRWQIMGQEEPLLRRDHRCAETPRGS
jgi:hypothetical protein